MAKKKKSTATGIARPTHTLSNVFAPEALEFGPQAVNVSGVEWRRVYLVAAFPEAVDAGWLTSAANLPGVTLSLQARPQDAFEMIKALNRRIGGLAGQLATGKNAPITEQRLSKELEDAMALMKQIDSEQQGVFQCGVFCTVSAPDPETGLRRAKRLEGQLAAQGMRARMLAFRQEEGLQASGPWGLWPQPLHTDNLWPVQTVAAAWPFGGGGINHGSGIVLGHDADGGLVMINRWNPPPESGATNKNFAILSPPGGGKSHATKLMMLREWALGAKIFVIDPEREYRTLARAVEGTWINAVGGKTRINPLQAPDLPLELLTGDDDVSGSADQSPLMVHVQRVMTFFESYLESLTPLQRALLEQAVEVCYATKGITPDTSPEQLSALTPEDWPHVGDVYAYCQQQTGEDWTVLTALLRSAGEGMLSSLWAGPSTAPSTQNADFVVLDIHDLQDMPDRIKRAQFVNVLGWITDAVLKTRRDEKKILIVDEAWMLIDPRNPQTLQFMKSSSKRVRKYDGSFMVVTQNVADFLAPAIAGEGEQVLTNAAYTLLLRQGGKDLQSLTTLFTLSDAEQDMLSNARVGEGLLIAGNDRAWITVDTAPHESQMMYGPAHR